MKSIRNALVVFAIAVVGFAPGCTGNKFPVKPAKGKVVAQGKPVTTGSVTFTPLPTSGDIETGKPAAGAVGQDGTFVLSTFDRFDGAIVGKHSVRYTGAEDEDSEDNDAEGTPDENEAVSNSGPAKKQQPQYVQKGEIIVEVTASGPNDFTIELQPPGK